MSQDTSHNDLKHSEITKSTVSMSLSFWFIIILVVLFVSALNFVNVMSNSSEEKKEPKKTEAPATINDTPKTDANTNGDNAHK